MIARDMPPAVKAKRGRDIDGIEYKFAATLAFPSHAIPENPPGCLKPRTRGICLERSRAEPGIRSCQATLQDKRTKRPQMHREHYHYPFRQHPSRPEPITALRGVLTYCRAEMAKSPVTPQMPRGSERGWRDHEPGLLLGKTGTSHPLRLFRFGLEAWALSESADSSPNNLGARSAGLKIKRVQTRQDIR